MRNHENRELFNAKAQTIESWKREAIENWKWVRQNLKTEIFINFRFFMVKQDSAQGCPNCPKRRMPGTNVLDFIGLNNFRSLAL